MNKVKKLWVSIFLSILLTLSFGICLVGCGDDKDKKYDVAIRIGCSDGKVYEFPVGTDELHVEFEYDGIDRTFGVRAYNLPDHPHWSNDWISPSGEGANVFSLSIAKEHFGQTQSVLERGLYCVLVHADSTSTLWNVRTVRLYIEVN